MEKKRPVDTKFIAERITTLRMEHKVSEYQLSLDLGFSKGYFFRKYTAFSQFPL